MTETITVTGDYKYIGIRSEANALYLDKITIVWESTAATKVDAELAFPESDYTAYLNKTFTAPTLTNPNNVTVEYTSSNEEAATVDASTGAITLVAKGTTTITAKVPDTNTSYKGSASYTLTVEAADIANTPETAYTVAKAIELIDAGDGLSAEVYVKGIISQIDKFDDTDKYITYWISDDGTTTKQFECYHGKGLNGADFTALTDLKKGATVIVKGKMTKFNTTYEFGAGNVLVSYDESTAGGDPVDPEIETVNTFPYEEAFSNSLGKFYIEDVTLPEGLTYIWAKNNQYVKASAFKSGNYASESWLISPYFDLTSTTAPAFTFNHALNKFNSVDEMKEQATLWIKEKDGDWTQLSGMNYTENSDWTFISAGEFDLSSYKGKTIQIGFKYVSTTASAGTWEIKEFALTDGEEDPNVKGGENNPYTVEEIMAFDPDNAESLPETKVWVKGYIAGCVNTDKGNELSTGDAVASNLALSSTGVVTSVIPVQLIKGTDVRTALNIVDTPANVGKEVLVYGNIQKYCGVAGVKNTSDYKFTGNSTEITGIQNLTIDTDVNAPMYNLKGERVDANYRGVVIKGGKKTIQK